MGEATSTISARPARSTGSSFGFGWSSEQASPGTWFDEWRDALCRTHLDWSLLLPRTEVRARPRYHAEVEQRELVGARVVRCTCDPIHGTRSRHELARSGEAWFGVVLVVEGAETIGWDDRQVDLSPGEFVLWDSERELSFDVRERLSKVSLLVPKARFRRVIPDVDRYHGHVVRGTHGAAALAAEHLRALARHDLSPMPLLDQERVLDGTLELVGAALGGVVGPGVGPGERGEASARSARVERIRAWIASHLEDPDLGPERVAAAHGISVRTLHAWFQAEGASVSRSILGLRLERCRRDLERETSATITEIAFRWGFNDVAYFSRAFKRRFGRSPRDHLRCSSNHAR